HWADGGETCMENLILLCRRHHRLVHEGGFGVKRGPGDEIRFSYPGGDPLPASADGRYRGNAVRIKMQNHENGLDIGPRTLPPRWRGEVMDYDHAQFLLQQWE
ncbi:MAG: HNH endonuclease signature motif containing protein, partial [Xanthomonadales bacterium]|nr:HNH endonuclease signature motif containing protein [Xanthomonadales bacterium]